MDAIPVKYRKLGREKAWGFCHDDEGVELDSRLKGKKHLEILLHECLHFVFPELDEGEIVQKSILITNTLWGEHYRRVDNDQSNPLQDGTT